MGNFRPCWMLLSEDPKRPFYSSARSIHSHSNPLAETVQIHPLYLSRYMFIYGLVRFWFSAPLAPFLLLCCTPWKMQRASARNDEAKLPPETLLFVSTTKVTLHLTPSSFMRKTLERFYSFVFPFVSIQNLIVQKIQDPSAENICTPTERK